MTRSIVSVGVRRIVRPRCSGIALGRQELDLVLRRDGNDFDRIREPVNFAEEGLQLPCGRDPEKGAGWFVRFIEVTVRDAARHPHQIARLGLRPDSIKLEVEDAFLDKDELVLRGMNVNGHKLSGE